MADIFLSYAQEDRPHAERLARVLENLGWSVWWDRQLVPGTVYDQAIEKELERSSCVIVLWSPFSVRSRWVRAEAEVGANRGVLVPAMITPQISIPVAFRSIQAAGLSTWLGEDPKHPALESLREAVAGIVRPGSVGSRPRPADGRFRRRYRQPKALVVALVLLVGGISTGIWLWPDETKDSGLLFTLATSEYHSKDYLAASRRLSTIAGDEAFSRSDRQLSLEFLASLFVEASMLDSATTAISQLLDLEPPLITLAPNQYSTELGRIYNDVRRERIARLTPPRQRPTVRSVAVLSFQQTSDGDDFLTLQKGLAQLVETELLNLGVPIRASGDLLNTIIQEQELAASPHDFRSLSAADSQQFYAWSGFGEGLPTGPRPFVNLGDLENWLAKREKPQGLNPSVDPRTLTEWKIRPVRHYVSGSYHVNEDSAGGIDRISVTAWMFDVQLGQIVAWAVESVVADSIATFASSLTHQLVNMVSLP